LPSETSARIARNTQLVLQHETDLCRTVDPFGGSFHVERLTHDLAARAGRLIEEIEALGGMAKAIDTGLPKLRIEEAAARRQARIDAGEDVIVGVNRYRSSARGPAEVLRVDNEAVRAVQIDRLAKLRRERDGAAVARALDALRAAARGDANLLAASIDAARVGATVGEISEALADVFGRYDAPIRTIGGVYAAAAKMSDVEAVQRLTRAFLDAHGRRPRILVAKVGQDGHDRGAKVVATAFADM